MNKVLVCGLAAMCFSPLAYRATGQTYVQTSPTASQTVSQPAGTALTVNRLTVPSTGILNLGTSSIQGDSGGIQVNTNGFFYVQGADGSVVSMNEGSLYVTAPDGSMGVLSGNQGNVVLSSAPNIVDVAGIVLDSSRGWGGGISALISGGEGPGTFQVEDTDIAAQNLLCVTPSTDFVGVSVTNCQAYGLLDVSNRETLGDGNMHWFADNAVPTWTSNHQTVIAGWNSGISNPSNGVLSFDSTVDHDEKASIKVGNITLAPNSSNASGSITFPDGTVQGTAWNGTTLGGDYAESIDVTGDRAIYEPGDVIVIDDTETGRFDKSTKPYSKMVAGVYSTRPGLVGRRLTAVRPNKEAEVPMAMMGIVPTKVSAENGAIRRGDLLVSSGTPGYAMKGTNRHRLAGAVIGKALAPLTSGTGTIEVLLALQ